MPAVSIQQAFELALQHHQAGRLADAETLYRQILALQPNSAGALHYLGVLAHQVGRHDAAAELIRQAIALDPNNATAHSNLGNAYRTMGRLDEAVAAFRRAIQLQPDYAEAHNNLGNALGNQGRFEEAVAAYRRAIQLMPDSAQVHGNLGNALRDQGHLDEAVVACRRAIQLQPDFPEAHYHLGNALRDEGRFDEAVAAYRRAIQLQPDFPEAHGNLGNALQDQGHLDEAVAAYRRAIQLQPNFPKTHSNLGNALKDQGHLDEAAAACRRAIQLQPDYAEAHNNLGIALIEIGHLDEAVTACRRAIQLQPDFPEAYSNLGSALQGQGHLDEAAAACRRALELKPDYAEAHNNFGNVLRDQGQLDEAVAAYRRALGLKPDYAEAYNNLGNALTDQGQFDEADTALRRALEIKPDFADAQFGQSILCLLRGDLEHGWPWYEARWNVRRSMKRNFSQPMWNGGVVEGRRVLVHAEQGLGDSIQFIRYAEMIAGRGGEVVVECPRALLKLFQGVEGVAELVVAGDPLPPFDLHVPMLSQPLVFQTTLENIPQEVPYLFVDASRREAWKNRLGIDRKRIRIGLAWAGNPQHRRNQARNISLEMLLPLLLTEGVDFFSLQLGHETEQIRQFPGAARIIDHTAHIDDFADTAALMAELDLVISVDTSVAHLAGALGRPAWTLLPFIPDWRWGLEREKTPWYPTMRLFRQSQAGDWVGAVERVAAALRASLNNPEISSGTTIHHASGFDPTSL